MSFSPLAGFVLGLATIGSTAAHSLALRKRAEGLSCDPAQVESCVSWYTTGSAQCSSGFERTTLEAPGDPLGSYCERPCSDSEKESCNGERCKFYSGQCRLYPGNSICAKAMQTCGRPMPMPQRYCNQSHLGFAVKYDDAAGTCAVDPNPNKDLKKVIFLLGPPPSVDLHLVIICDPLTTASARNFTEAIFPGGPQNCKFSADYSQYELRWQCDYRKPTWDNIKTTAQAACEAAEGPNGAKPEFYSAKS